MSGRGQDLEGAVDAQGQFSRSGDLGELTRLTADCGKCWLQTHLSVEGVGSGSCPLLSPRAWPCDRVLLDSAALLQSPQGDSDLLQTLYSLFSTWHESYSPSARLWVPDWLRHRSKYVCFWVLPRNGPLPYRNRRRCYYPMNNE